MLILATLVFLLSMSLLWLHFVDELDILFVPLVLSIATFSIVLATLLVSIPVNRMSVRSDIVQLEAIRNTPKNSDLESATWRIKVADANTQLASTQYYNHTVWDIWIPDEVDNVKPIR